MVEYTDLETKTYRIEVEYFDKVLEDIAYLEFDVHAKSILEATQKVFDLFEGYPHEIIMIHKIPDVVAVS